MKINQTSYATAMRRAFVAPTLGAAGDSSANGHALGMSPITGAAVGTGHRTWSPPIT